MDPSYTNSSLIMHHHISPLPFKIVVTYRILCVKWEVILGDTITIRKKTKKTYFFGCIFLGGYTNDIFLHQSSFVNVVEEHFFFFSWFGFPLINGECKIFPQLSNIINTSFLNWISIQHRKQLEQQLHFQCFFLIILYDHKFLFKNLIIYV